jgi:hypothetical protein
MRQHGQRDVPVAARPGAHLVLTRAEAKQAIGRYIDGSNNPVRRHSTLDYVDPVQFERLAGSYQTSRLTPSKTRDNLVVKSVEHCRGKST